MAALSLSDSSSSATSVHGSGQDISSSRSQLAAACRDKEFDEARHLLAAGADPRGSTCGFFNWTALHFCCQHGELGFTKELIEVYGISAEAEDKEGRTPLHIACQFGHVTISQYLIGKCKCNPDYLDFEEQTPLHHAVGWLSECSESNALEVAKFLISFAQCNPHHRDINGKNALLHACEKGFLTVVQFLINSCGASTAEVDSYGNSCLHLAASYANNLQMVKYLMNLTPGQVCSPKGNTVLHAACAANSDLDIIKYLLILGKYDPNARNEKREIPLDLTTKPEIKRLLYMHGATPANVVEKHGAVCGDSVDCREPILKVLVLGNSSSGKSTLIKAIQREGSPFVFSFSQQRTAKTDDQTRGLQIVDFHNKTGHFAFYDFGGGEEYRCLYSALLHHILHHSIAAVILVVNLCESTDELRRQIFTWLSLVNDNCTTVKGQLRVTVLGSHSDVLKSLKGDLSKIWKDLNVDFPFSQYSKLDLVDNIALDCQRSESPQMTKLREHLSSSYQSLCLPEPIHFNAQCLHNILDSKFNGLLAVSVQDLCSQISLSEDSNVSASVIEYFIPCNEQVLSDLCIYMNDVGLAMYLHRDTTEKSLIILNYQLLLNILATLFIPVQSGHPHGGIIYSGKLLIPPKCDISEAVNALEQLEVCQGLPVDCVLEKKSSSSDETYYNQYLYCPSLAVNSIPKSIWAFDSRFKCYFGWTLRFGAKVSSRFTEVLLIRISSVFFQISQNENVHFTSWKNGISGLSGKECEFIAEVNNGATCILIVVRSLTSTLQYLKLRSQLISVCYNVVHELCSGVVTEELFIDPFEAMQYPLKPSSYIAYFTFTEIVKAVKGTSATVQSTTGDKLLVKDLIGCDPYIDLGSELLHCIFESQEHNSMISDDHLHQLALVMNANDYLTKLVLSEEGSSSEIYQMLLDWCCLSQRTYRSLWEAFNQATVLASTSRAA